MERLVRLPLIVRLPQMGVLNVAQIQMGKVLPVNNHLLLPVIQPVSELRIVPEEQRGKDVLLV